MRGFIIVITGDMLAVLSSFVSNLVGNVVFHLVLTGKMKNQLYGSSIMSLHHSSGMNFTFYLLNMFIAAIITFLFVKSGSVVNRISVYGFTGNCC